MGLIVVLDINGQRLESALTLARLLDVAPVRKVMISGAHGVLDAWINRLSRKVDKADVIDVVKTAGRRDESTIMLSAAAVSMMLIDPEARSCDWLLISRREGFQGLGEQLQRMGASSFAWSATLTQDVVKSIVGGEDGVSSAVREVAEGMLARNQHKPVLIGAFANTLIELVPEMRKAEDRERVFGVRKFKAICVAVGLKVKGDFIHSSQKP